MSLSAPIDARSTTKYLKVDQFCYPMTIMNVENDDNCWFRLKINFSIFNPFTPDFFDPVMLPLPKLIRLWATNMIPDARFWSIAKKKKKNHHLTP